MDKEFKDKLKGTLIVPIGLSIVLVPFSILVGWNLISLFLFWFVSIPLLSIYLPTTLSGNRNHLFESLVGLVIFYAMMTFMIYDHYQTDYFQIMILSFGINLVLVSVINLTRRTRRLTH